MKAKAETGTGGVTGLVTCADTNAPARFAVVTLEQVPGEAASPVNKDGEDSSNATATTDLDGRFVLEKVPAGRYFVIAIISGYMDALARFDRDDLNKLGPETVKEMLKIVPTVRVEANQVAQSVLRLEHASELSGTVVYDDGSPAINLTVKLWRKNKDGVITSMEGVMIPGFGSQVTTDDRGVFRIIGLPPGEYAVSASMRMVKTSLAGLIGGNGLSIGTSSGDTGEVVVYSGSKLRRQEAKVFKVGDGEQIGGLDITIPLASLREVKGTLTAKRDGHALSRGHVELLYADDRKEAQDAEVKEDGSFLFPYVPEGQYVLAVKAGADVEFTPRHEFNSNFMDEKVVKKYGDAEIPLTVAGETLDVVLAVPDVLAKVAEQ